ncbi:hypothetical protein COCMIDRAFT_103959 [Bipolaris oryzae ATCC 44560]|uniref:Cell wall hydroxyproline-rich glycoprotein n=1 Tax=Bipolaris oryzae ATCC 44560 TaxID=930090 RepID=W6ZFL7_COCMI|nr:uncharacterized protein COCMIDRAFT_103959 [Bipolaris oryzae ATCC 44560]EUC42281.1 hypothetical protein COCMIDRAFT_103959 [Bipolaris oryzae ATCC 44560]
MLTLVLSGFIALAQAAPAQKVASPNGAANIPANLLRDLHTAKEFANHVSGPQNFLSNWTAEGSNLCNWNGFYCDIVPDTNATGLASIDFNQFGLTGNLKLTGFIDKLPDLALLHINGNSFSGDVPDFSGLRYLYEIDLSDNKFSGPFPQSVLKINQLTFLDLRFNQFYGPIPDNVFTAYPSLEALFLNDNKFSGRIPNTIGSFAGEYLVLANNNLSGSIRDSLASANPLKEFIASGNQLSGSIPGAIGRLPNLHLFDVSNNKLTGTVPEELCASKSLTSIVLTGNKLSKNLGPICQASKAKGILQI